MRFIYTLEEKKFKEVNDEVYENFKKVEKIVAFTGLSRKESREIML